MLTEDGWLPLAIRQLEASEIVSWEKPGGQHLSSVQCLVTAVSPRLLIRR